MLHFDNEQHTLQNRNSAPPWHGRKVPAYGSMKLKYNVGKSVAACANLRRDKGGLIKHLSLFPSRHSNPYGRNNKSMKQRLKLVSKRRNALFSVERNNLIVITAVLDIRKMPWKISHFKPC